MIGVPMNPNSVYISMVQTGCCKAEFDSTYPVHLNGIISQHEFQESINNINRTIASTVSMIVVVVVFIATVIGGMICFTVGGMSGVNSHSYGFPTLIGVGMGLSIFGSLFFIIAMIVITFQRTSRMRQAVAQESVKYSTRSTPCSWRLETTRYFVGGYGNNNTRTNYHLIIDIGHSFASGNNAYYSNQVTGESSYLAQQQNNFAPPAYSSGSTGFCSKCGAARSDLSARFCSSCGQAFNKY